MMLSASVLGTLAIKSLAVAGFALCLLRLARRRTPAERSVIAHLGLLTLLMLPLASLALPQWAPFPSAAFATDAGAAAQLPTAIQLTGTPAALPPPPPEPATIWPDIGELALWIYAIPLLLMLLMMSVAVLRLFAMGRRAEVLVDASWLSALAQAQRRMGFKHGTALLVSDELRSPVSWGVLRPTILLDPRAVATASDAEAIIAHELAHVARLDWAKLLLGRLTCALFWFNPFVWLLARESHQLREEAADDSVLMTDIAGADYAALLVNAARHDNSAVLIAAHGVAPAGNSLRRRITRALDGQAQRGPAGAAWGALCLLVGLAIAGPVAAFSTISADEPYEGIVFAAALPITANALAPRAIDAGKGKAPEEEAPLLTPEDLVSMRAVGVTAETLVSMRNERARPDEIIAAHATGTDASYVAEMRGIFGDVDVDELIGADAVGVDASYARAMRSALPAAGLDEIIGARAIGISPQYVRSMRSMFPRIEIDEITGLRALGVTAADVRALGRGGGDAITPDEVMALHAVGAVRSPAPPRFLPQPPAVSARLGNAIATVGPNGVATARQGDGTSAAISSSKPPGPPRDN
ncbi:M56 family metallopeptidase [Altererythrobacter sp. SALINAS58]|uniref:M56 family metallopeptidase n=1 Tax=Alteripontixanthobacter muriae TaxID=2705546 RepID=UPI001576F6B7|nr:M56 family metallopeptidase [Alteripontixanthobacter muriae]NTZ43233.1 M56 family metallopeptidase [Alteripontixanthobacter muriae]